MWIVCLPMWHVAWFLCICACIHLCVLAHVIQSVCIVHMLVCVFVCVSTYIYGCGNFSFLLLPGEGLSSRDPNPSPCLLSSLQLGSVLPGTLEHWGLIFNPNPPFAAALLIHMQVTYCPPILFFHLSMPSLDVVSRLKFKSLDNPCCPHPWVCWSDQAAAGSGRKHCLTAYFLAGSNGQKVFWDGL